MPPITTPQENFRRVYQAVVASSYANAEAVLTTTQPTALALSSSQFLFDINSTPTNGANPSLLYVMPFLVSATTAQTGIGMRIIGWRKYLEAAGTTFWYVPTVLADLTLTFTSGTVPSYTIDSVANTRTFSGITQNLGTPAGYLYSPATASPSNVEPAFALIDIAGCSYVTAQFKSSGAPNMGCFWATL
jgi:hypothetical protein